ncbi:MAG: acyl-CoA synthetase [Xanthomonadales bacterium]|nr:hypothetical protein [Xanthomonadales bacterium]MCC6591836.1 acyl-CoA synthetase [Xanthomonadales bacterium]
MPEIVGLDRLLPALAGRACVAWRGDTAVSGDDFLVRVGAWHALLDLPAGALLALAHADAVEFAAALYAAWLRELVVLVPGDTLAGTLATLADAAAFAGECGPATTHPAPVGGASAIAGPLPHGLDGTLVLQTSGSTGAPLRVAKTLRQLDAEVRTLEAAFGARLGPARIAATVSHQHIYGLLFRVLWPLAAGRAFEAHAHAYLESVAPLLTRDRLALVASPAHLKRIPAGIDWHPGGARLSALFSSGGPLAFDAAQAAQAATGECPIEVWGSTETGGIAWRQQSGADAPFAALPGVELECDDAGTLRLRSPHLENAGWIELADRGERAVGGGVHLRGRNDRIVKIEEKRVSLSAIERAARAVGLLDEARALVLAGERTQVALVGVPGEPGREMLRTQGRRALAAALRAGMATQVERVALPRRFRFVGALPQNAQGKTTEAMLAALFDWTESRPLLPFFDWRTRDAQRASAELWIGPDLYHFQGHFPSRPILPGVAQIDWAIALARLVFPLPPRLSRMETLKFQAMIEPGARLLLDLEWKPERGQLEFRAHSKAGAHASARLVFAER